MKSCVSRGAAALLIAMPFALSAQEASPTDDEVTEEIIVTAQKRATSLQDVPFSIAAPVRARSRFAASARARSFAISLA